MISVLKYCFGLPEVAFEAGTILISEGTERGPLYILVDGGIEVVRNGIVVARSQLPGAIFGEMSALLDVPHTASVRAVSDVRVHVIDFPNQFLESRPQIALQVAAMLARRLNDASAYLVDMTRQYASEDCPLDKMAERLTSIAHSQDDTGPNAG